MKKHIVRLPDQVRQMLRKMVQSGTRPAQVVRRCQVLLKSDEGCTDGEIAEHVGCSDRTVRTLRKQFCGGGVEQAIYDSPRSGRPATFTERQRVVALACTDPPQGRQRWTLELLCEHAVKQGVVESVGKSEVALWLKEHDLKPWRKKRGASPN